MNLALDYLVRTKSIRNFFDTPSSLFLERGEENIIITFEGKASDPRLSVKLWPITRLPVDRFLPTPSCRNIQRKDVFDCGLVPDGYSPITYFEESVDTTLNTFKKPMEAETYYWFIDQMMYSENHRYFKEHWLWKNFVRNVLTEELQFLYPERDMLMADCLERGGDDHAWHRWRLWRRTLFTDGDNRAACELIFMS